MGTRFIWGDHPDKLYKYLATVVYTWTNKILNINCTWNIKNDKHKNKHSLNFRNTCKYSTQQIKVNNIWHALKIPSCRKKQKNVTHAQRNANRNRARIVKVKQLTEMYFKRTIICNRNILKGLKENAYVMRRAMKDINL